MASKRQIQAFWIWSTARDIGNDHIWIEGLGGILQTCSWPGKLNKRSACIRVLDFGWKKATSWFLKPEKKLGRK